MFRYKSVVPSKGEVTVSVAFLYYYSLSDLGLCRRAVHIKIEHFVFLNETDRM